MTVSTVIVMVVMMRMRMSRRNFSHQIDHGTNAVPLKVMLLESWPKELSSRSRGRGIEREWQFVESNGNRNVDGDANGETRGCLPL